MAAPGTAKYSSAETGHEPSFKFLAKNESQEDISLQEFDTGRSQQEALRQLNILAGNMKPIQGKSDYEKAVRDIQRAERLLGEIVQAVYGNMHYKEGKGINFNGQKLAQFNNKLISLCLNLRESEIKPIMEKIMLKVQSEFFRKHPQENRERYHLSTRGWDKGVLSAIQFIKERGIEIEPGLNRKFYYNSQADRAYGVDILELNYREENNVVDVEEMNLIQIKSGSRTPGDERRIREKHQFFLNEFVTSAKEFDKTYLPAIEFKSDDEQLAFNEALAAIQTEIEILGQRFTGGKMAKDEFVIKLVNLIIKSAPSYNDSDTKAFQGLSLKDKLWYVGRFIRDLHGFILDENMASQLEGLIDPLTDEVEKSGYMPPRATIIKKIHSHIWSPGGEPVGSPKNPGQLLHPRDNKGNYLPPAAVNDPVVIYS